MTQEKRKPLGAYKSVLIPYKKIIFDAWFKERKTGCEIQYILAEQHNIKVSLDTIYQFIRVRRKRPDPHDLPPFMQPQEPRVKSQIQEEKTGTPMPVAKEVHSTQCKWGKPLTEKEQAIINKMMNQTRQEAYEEAVRLKMAKKKAKQP